MQTTTPTSLDEGITLQLRLYAVCCVAQSHCLTPYAIFSFVPVLIDMLSTDFVCWALCQSIGMHCVRATFVRLPQLPTPSTTPIPAPDSIRAVETRADTASLLTSRGESGTTAWLTRQILTV